MNNNKNAGQNGRKIGGNPKVTIIAGPGIDGDRGAWKYAKCGNTQIPIYKNKSEARPLYQVACSTATGEATKQSFREAQEAIEFASQLAQLPPGAAVTFSSIPREQAVDIVMAMDLLVPILGPLGISVAAGIAEYAGAKAEVGQKDLREIVRTYCAEPWVKKSLTPTPVVLEEFITACRNSQCREAYLKTLFYTLRRLADHVKATPIGQVTMTQLEQVIFTGGSKPRSHKTYRTNIRTFFQWCKLQEYLNPGRPSEAEKLGKIRVDAATPEVYTVAEARAMLTKTTEVPRLLLLALGFFSGIRHAELGRIDWKHIHSDDKIVVEPKVGKLRDRRRTIPVLPVLKLWLQPFIGRAGFVLPYLSTRDKTSAKLRGQGGQWKRNGLRHSFASYRLADTNDLMGTADEDGHSATILETVYRDRVTKVAAEAYFQLTPEACGQTDWDERVRQYLEENPPRLVRRTRKCKGPRPIVPLEEPQTGGVETVISEIAQTGQVEGGNRAAA